MKTFMLTYTADYQVTFHTILINAPTFTEAYVRASLYLPSEAIISDLFEVE